MERHYDNVSLVWVLCCLDVKPAETFKKLDFDWNEKSTKIVNQAPILHKYHEMH